MDFRGVTLSAMILFSSQSHADTIHQDTLDIRLYAAFVQSKSIKVTIFGNGENEITWQNCRRLERRPQWKNGARIYDRVELDCTEALERFLQTPLLNDKVHATAYTKPDSDYIVTSEPMYQAQVLEFYTATRAAALPDADGIGLYSWAGDRLFPIHEALEVGRSKFRNGDEAVVHKFAAVYQSQAFGSFPFKPWLQYSADGNIYRNFEDLGPRIGHPNVTGGLGSGNYTIQFQQKDKFIFENLLVDKGFATLPGQDIRTPKIHQRTEPLGILTATHWQNKVPQYSARLKSYDTSSELHFNLENVATYPLQTLWFRLADEITVNKDISLYYRYNDGEPIKGNELHGGNCFGRFMECFQLTVAAGVTGKLKYWFELMDEQGEIFIYDNLGSPFEVSIIPDATAYVKMSASGVETEGTLEAGSSFALKYDPAVALQKLRQRLGRFPEGIRFSAIVTDGNGNSRRVPFGLAWGRGTNGGSELVYIAELGLVPVKVPTVEPVLVEFVITATQFGRDELELREGPFVIE